VAHTGIGLAGLFGKSYDNFMVNGKPGNGSTPIELLLGGVMSTWYLGSILGVIWAHYAGESIARQAAIIVCSIYHIKSTVSVFMATEKSMAAAFNPQKLTKDKVLKLHGVLSVACILVYLNA